MSPINKDAEYRQELKTGYYQTTEEGDKLCAAINENVEVGSPTTLLIDILIARSAGVKGGRLHDLLEALTHTTFSTNYTGGKKWYQNDKSKNKQSPLA